MIERRQTLRHVDATPDEGYVRRILEAHIDESMWSDTTTGLPPESLLCIEMNKIQKERNRLLKAALSKLEDR